MRLKLGAFCAAVTALFAAAVSAVAAPTAAEAPPKCGVARWDVKTLSDPLASQVKYTPRNTSIRTLRRKRPTVKISLLTPRLKGTIEMRVWRLKNVRLIDARRADDRDIHLVIKDDAGRSMIVEFANPDCAGAVASGKRAAMKKARAALIAACGSIPTSFVDLQGRATIEGVGFFDEVHGQRGVAPNGVELHPVLRFTSSNCSRV